MKSIVKALIFFFLLQSTYSFACVCKKMQSVKDEFERVDAVLIGKVISVENYYLEADSKKLNKYPDSDYKKLLQKSNGKKYKIKVYKAYKGSIVNRIVTIYTNSSNCGSYFKVGTDYIIYGYKYNFYMTNHDVYDFPEKQVYWSNKCLRTRAYEQKEFDEIKKVASEK